MKVLGIKTDLNKKEKDLKDLKRLKKNESS